ncbi:phage tail tape measure protein [Acuticoccus sediminis]|uniref:phage tail tape measure protein n=1 Tax=Acuticoccus sediminis TaxID=2184697 RepID=UPI001CFD658E|nr:phage tail tape measure protein [Acuticoccus sediminis]
MAGSAVIGALRVNLGIDTAAFTKGLDSARKSLASAGKSMQSVGAKMSIGITAPVVAFGASIVKTAGDFEAAMNNVGAVTSASGDQMKALADQAKLLGRTTQFSASQAADAMGFLGMAGFSAEQIMAALPGTLQLAAAAQMDLASSADIVSNVMSGYALEAKDLGRINDVLVKTFTRTNTDLRQLGEAMKYAGPVASSAGISFEEAAAALGLMGNAGIQASMAGTSLKGAISRVLTPTKTVSKAMAKAGLNFTDAQGRLIGLDEIIRQLEPHADDAGLFMQLFGQRAGPAMAALVSQGSDALVGLTDELENSGGTAERIANAQMKGFNGAMKSLVSAFEGLKLAIADSGLLDWATQAVQALTGFIQTLGETNPEILKWGTIVAGLAAILGPVVVAIGAVALALSAISLPVAAGIAAVVALGGVFIAFGDDIVAALSGAWDWLKRTFGPPLSLLMDAAKGVVQSFGDLFTAIFGEGTGNTLAAVGDSFANFFSVITDFASGLIVDTLVASIEALAAGLRGVRDIVEIVSQLISGDFAGALDTMSGTVSAVKDALYNAFVEMGDVAWAAVTQIAADIANAFNGLPAQMRAIGTNIIQGLINGINDLTGKGGLLENTVFGVARRIKDGLVDYFDINSPSRVMHEVGADIMLGLNNGIRDGEGGVLATIGRVAKSISEAFKSMASGDGIGDALTSAADAAAGALGNAWERVKGSLKSSLGSMFGDAAGSVQSLDGVDATGSDGGAKLKGTATALRDLLAEATEVTSAGVLQAVTAAVAGLGTVVAGLGTALQTVTTLVRGEFQDALLEVTTAATAVKDGLVNAFAQMVEPVRAAVGHIAASVMQAFAELPARMVEVGRQIVQGLIDGVRSMAASAVETVRSVGSSMYNAVTGYFDIRSPSQLMHDVGVNVMAGLQTGLQAGQAGVVGAARQTAAQVQQAIAMVQGAGDPWAGLKTSTDAATGSLQSMENVGQSLGSTIGGAFKSLIDGSKSVKEVLADLLGKLADMFFNQGFQAIVGAFGGTGTNGSGGFLSGLLGGLANAFKGIAGFAGGGVMEFGGGNNSMDSHLAAFRVSAGEKVKVTRGDEEARAGAGSVGVTVNVEGANGDQHVINLVKQGVQVGMQQLSKQLEGPALLERIDSAQLRFQT